jgi:hypothetical protein
MQITPIGLFEYDYTNPELADYANIYMHNELFTSLAIESEANFTLDFEFLILNSDELH